MAQNKTLKLITSESIHRVKENPTTFAGLQIILQNILGAGPFLVSYKDDEGDEISVTNDMSLLEAYESTEAKILKFYIKRNSEQKASNEQTLFKTESDQQVQSNVSQEISITKQEEKVQCTQENSQKSSSSQLNVEKNPSEPNFKFVVSTLESKEQSQNLENENVQKQDSKEQIQANLKAQENEYDLYSEMLNNQTENRENFQTDFYQAESQRQQEFQFGENQNNDQEWQQQFPEFQDFRSGRRGRRRSGRRGGRRGQWDKLQNNQPFDQSLQNHHFAQHSKFFEKHRMLLEKHIRPEFQRMTNIILQELKISQLQGPYEGQAKLVVHESVRCDGCQVFPIVGVRYKCSICQDFDFCMKCEAQIDHDHAFLKIKDPSMAPQAIIAVIDENDQHHQNQQSNENQQQQNQFNPQKMVQDIWQSLVPTVIGKVPQKTYQSQFLEHITCPDNTYVEPGKTILKVWKVKNIGNAAWPFNTILILNKGNLDVQPSQIPLLKPGEDGNISMKLQIPNIEGNFEGIYEFMTPQGDAFGEKLVVKVVSRNQNNSQLNEKSQSKQEVFQSQHAKAQEIKAPQLEINNPIISSIISQPSEPQPQKSELDEQIDKVIDFGFQNRELIKELIQKYKGDLNQVVNNLVNQ